MSTTYTANLKLQKPAHNDPAWDVPLRADLDSLDGLTPVGSLAVTTHEVPSASLLIDATAGSFRSAGGAAVSYAGASSVAVAASSTTSVYLTDAGVLTQSTAGFPATGNVVPLAVVVSGGSTITSVTDARPAWASRGGHVHWGIGTPTVAAGAGAGTGPTVSVTGSDQAGLVTVTTGTTPSASAVVATVTFGQAFSSTPRAVVLTPAGANAAALAGAGKVFADSAGPSTTSWTLNVGSSALAASTAYRWWYAVVG